MIFKWNQTFPNDFVCLKNCLYILRKTLSDHILFYMWILGQGTHRQVNLLSELCTNTPEGQRWLCQSFSLQFCTEFPILKSCLCVCAHAHTLIKGKQLNTWKHDQKKVRKVETSTESVSFPTAHHLLKKKKKEILSLMSAVRFFFLVPI